MVSSNGKYRLYLREAGYLDLTCGNTTIWVACTVGYNVDSLYFGKDGLGLFLYGKDGSNWMLYGKTEMSVWKPRSQNAGQVEMLILHDDGNLVLYDRCGKTIWESDTSGKCFQGLDQLIYLKNTIYISKTDISILFLTICSKKYSNLLIKSDFYFKCCETFALLGHVVKSIFFHITWRIGHRKQHWKYFSWCVRPIFDLFQKKISEKVKNAFIHN